MLDTGIFQRALGECSWPSHTFIRTPSAPAKVHLHFSFLLVISLCEHGGLVFTLLLIRSFFIFDGKSNDCIECQMVLQLPLSNFKHFCTTSHFVRHIQFYCFLNYILSITILINLKSFQSVRTIIKIILNTFHPIRIVIAGLIKCEKKSHSHYCNLKNYL